MSLHDPLPRDVPTFDEAMRVVEQYPDTYETRVQELYNTMLDDPEHYPGADYDLGPDPAEWEVEEAAREQTRIEWELLYDDLLTVLERLDGEPCYRAITLPADVDPFRLDPLGRFWSWKIEGAQGQEGTPGYQQHPLFVTYQGRIDPQYLDWEETVLHNMIFGMLETEVAFVEGAPIWIDGAWVRSYEGPMFSWLERTVDNIEPIQAWRTI